VNVSVGLGVLVFSAVGVAVNGIGYGVFVRVAFVGAVEVCAVLRIVAGCSSATQVVKKARKHNNKTKRNNFVLFISIPLTEKTARVMMPFAA
jgi:hypothetical protein